ncbi:MAG: hypothetical protein ACI9Y8_001988 [Candidatus Omnitrophota bacterium]
MNTGSGLAIILNQTIVDLEKYLENLREVEAMPELLESAVPEHLLKQGYGPITATDSIKAFEILQSVLRNTTFGSDLHERIRASDDGMEFYIEPDADMRADHWVMIAGMGVPSPGVTSVQINKEHLRAIKPESGELILFIDQELKILTSQGELKPAPRMAEGFEEWKIELASISRRMEVLAGKTIASVHPESPLKTKVDTFLQFGYGILAQIVEAMELPLTADMEADMLQTHINGLERVLIIHSKMLGAINAMEEDVSAREIQSLYGEPNGHLALYASELQNLKVLLESVVEDSVPEYRGGKELFESATRVREILELIEEQWNSVEAQAAGFEGVLPDLAEVAEEIEFSESSLGRWGMDADLRNKYLLSIKETKDAIDAIAKNPEPLENVNAQAVRFSFTVEDAHFILLYRELGQLKKYINGYSLSENKAIPIEARQVLSVIGKLSLLLAGAEQHFRKNELLMDKLNIFFKGVLEIVRSIEMNLVSTVETESTSVDLEADLGRLEELIQSMEHLPAIIARIPDVNQNEQYQLNNLVDGHLKLIESELALLKIKLEEYLNADEDSRPTRMAHVETYNASRMSENDTTPEYKLLVETLNHIESLAKLARRGPHPESNIAIFLRSHLSTTQQSAQNAQRILEKSRFQENRFGLSSALIVGITDIFNDDDRMRSIIIENQLTDYEWLILFEPANGYVAQLMTQIKAFLQLVSGKSVDELATDLGDIPSPPMAPTLTISAPQLSLMERLIGALNDLSALQGNVNAVNITQYDLDEALRNFDAEMNVGFEYLSDKLIKTSTLSDHVDLSEFQRTVQTLLEKAQRLSYQAKTPEWGGNPIMLDKVFNPEQGLFTLIEFKLMDIRDLLEEIEDDSSRLAAVESTQLSALIREFPGRVNGGELFVDFIDQAKRLADIKPRGIHFVLEDDELLAWISGETRPRNLSARLASNQRGVAKTSMSLSEAKSTLQMAAKNKPQVVLPDPYAAAVLTIHLEDFGNFDLATRKQLLTEHFLELNEHLNPRTRIKIEGVSVLMLTQAQAIINELGLENLLLSEFDQLNGYDLNQTTQVHLITQSVLREKIAKGQLPAVSELNRYVVISDLRADQSLNIYEYESLSAYVDTLARIDLDAQNTETQKFLRFYAKNSESEEGSSEASKALLNALYMPQLAVRRVLPPTLTLHLDQAIQLIVNSIRTTLRSA